MSDRLINTGVRIYRPFGGLDSGRFHWYSYGLRLEHLHGGFDVLSCQLVREHSDKLASEHEGTTLEEGKI